VLSDSHDDLGRLAAAAESLAALGVRLAVHCGDITGPEAVAALRGLEVHWVLGNCDLDRPGLEAAMRDAGHRLHGRTGGLEVEGVRVAFTHGHRSGEVARLASAGAALVCHGHTHRRALRREGPTLVLCPGAVTLAPEPGLAVVHLPDLEVAWLDL